MRNGVILSGPIKEPLNLPKVNKDIFFAEVQINQLTYRS